MYHLPYYPWPCIHFQTPDVRLDEFISLLGSSVGANLRLSWTALLSTSVQYFWSAFIFRPCPTIQEVHRLWLCMADKMPHSYFILSVTNLSVSKKANRNPRQLNLRTPL